MKHEGFNKISLSFGDILASHPGQSGQQIIDKRANADNGQQQKHQQQDSAKLLSIVGVLLPHSGLFLKRPTTEKDESQDDGG
ncbi:MAG: hypothetical protein IPK53_09660 [bacterium]|nr:hypothetical protein [bacterium]